MTALDRVENFVGKIAAEEKRFSPALLDRGTESVIITIEADEDSSFA
jgi:hypothetical protein